MAKDYGSKGFLSFIILWMVSRKGRTGAEISKELQRRKGSRPSPGTIYPCLKKLKKKGLIKTASGKKYTLTPKGRKVLNESLTGFFDLFCDLDEMRSCCPGKR